MLISPARLLEIKVKRECKGPPTIMLLDYVVSPEEPVI